jgi:hypothetical protein
MKNFMSQYPRPILLCPKRSPRGCQGTFINDVTQIWEVFDPLHPALIVLLLILITYCHLSAKLTFPLVGEVIFLNIVGLD